MTSSFAPPEYFSDVSVEDIDKMVGQLGPERVSAAIYNLPKPEPEPEEEQPWWHGVALETTVGLAADWLLPGLDPISRGLNYGLGYYTNVAAQKLRGEKKISQGEAHTAGGFQAIPFGTTAKGFKGLRRAMYKGAAGGLVGRQVEVGIDEGRALTPGEAFTSAGVGAAFGGTFKGIQERKVLKQQLKNQIFKTMSDTSTPVYARTPIIPFKDDDISKIRYKQDLEYNKAVDLELKRWGMDDGIFDIDKFFKQVRKQDHADAIKSPKQGRDFIELFLTPKGKDADFYAMERSKSGDHQIFKARFIDFLEARGIPTSDVQYHHIAGLYDSLPLYHGLRYGSDEWWDLTALLLDMDINPGATVHKDRTNYMSVIGKAKQTGEISKKTGLASEKMPHGVAHLFYKDELGPQRHFNTDKIDDRVGAPREGQQSFWSKSELEAVKDNLDPITRKPLKGPYIDSETGDEYSTYREFKAYKFSSVVKHSEDIAIQAMKDFEALNPKGKLDGPELWEFLNSLDDKGLKKDLPERYQTNIMTRLIEEINEATASLENLDPKSDTYKQALASKLLGLDLPPEFIRTYIKKVLPGNFTISIESLKNRKPLKLSPKKYTK